MFYQAVFAYACGLGASDPRCGEGPVKLRDSTCLQSLLHPTATWCDLVPPMMRDPSANDIHQTLVTLNTQLAGEVLQAVRAQKLFLSLGGDHSCAIGTWCGACAGLPVDQRSLGLLWIDAHLDAHTPATTPSGALHGMPVAVLLGEGDPTLLNIAQTGRVLEPEQICIVGARSYERGEKALLERLGVRVYYMPEILERGLATVLNEAWMQLKQHANYLGLSIDLDGLDPCDAPGVGTAVDQGIVAKEFTKWLADEVADEPTLLGVEITEYNPALDQDGITARTIQQLAQACLRRAT